MNKYNFFYDILSLSKDAVLFLIALAALMIMIISISGSFPAN